MGVLAGTLADEDEEELHPHSLQALPPHPRLLPPQLPQLQPVLVDDEAAAAQVGEV